MLDSCQRTSRDLAALADLCAGVYLLRRSFVSRPSTATLSVEHDAQLRVPHWSSCEGATSPLTTSVASRSAAATICSSQSR